MGFAIGIGLLAFMIAGGLIVWQIEVREYNRGKCKCGGDWVSFDMDSQGGIGWNCNTCDNSMWTSYVRGVSNVSYFIVHLTEKPSKGQIVQCGLDDVRVMASSYIRDVAGGYKEYKVTGEVVKKHESRSVFTGLIRD